MKILDIDCIHANSARRAKNHHISSTGCHFTSGGIVLKITIQKAFSVLSAFIILAFMFMSPLFAFAMQGDSIEINSAANNDFAVPVVQYTSVPKGYKGIYSAKDLNSVRKNLNGKYILMNDIDLSGYDSWEPIGGKDTGNSAFFTGVLNGNGYVIKNLNISVSEFSGEYILLGVFAQLNNAVIHNLGIESGQISNSFIGYVGSIAGTAQGSIIENCFCKVFIDISTNTDITVGGIVGHAEDTTPLTHSSDVWRL